MATASTEVAAYWIDPDGASHLVGRGSQPTHDRWARRRRGITGESAEEAGWHRIVVVPLDGELFTYGRVALTPAQAAEVNRLATLHGTPNVRTWVRGQP